MFSTYSKTDVLAIRYIDNYILLGLGSVLHIVNKLNYKLEVKLDVLYPQRIHGIKNTPDNKLIIFGGKSLRICKLDITENSVKVSNFSDIYHFTDWIIASEYLSLENETKLVTLFAHNNLYICDLLNKQHKTIWCEEKCILYGGSIYSKNREDVVVFSGTVFQEILIWQINTSDCNVASILHRLKGHNGVIFSVSYDPITNIICSTSDDRTVRLWSINNEENKLTHCNNVDWNKVSVNLTATMYGHTARVWRAMIKDNIVVSIGEDSQICLWSINGQFLKKIQAHHGSPIWSVDVSIEDERMITGAADGSVYVWPFPFINKPQGSCILGQEIKKTPKFTGYLSDGIVLVIRDDGEINCFDPTTHVLNSSFSIPNFSSYLLIQVSSNKNRVSLASIDGFITIYELINENELKCLITEKIMDSRIFSMQWLNNDTLLLCGSLGRLNIVGVTSDGKLKILSEHILPESRERWTTSAISYENLLICGDRAGSVFVFEKSQDNGDFKTPVQMFHKIHGKLGIQACKIIGNKLLTAGRDGHLRFYEIQNENGEYTLELECAKNMPMDWISRILETEDDQYVFGFSEVDFIIFSVSLRRILIRIPCGGGHRSWDCIIDRDILKFIFIKDKQVHLQVLPFRKLDLLPVVEGYHSKEIYCLKKLKTLNNSCIFISGGEDCSLRISQGVQLMPTGGIEDFKTLDILNGHISSVKCLAVLNIENTQSYSKNIVFSGGGRAQLKAWEINIKLEKKEFSKDDLRCKLLDSFMLRGTDKERRRMKKGLKTTYDVESETRFMDINIHSCLDVSNLIFLFVACSDGFLRTFSWSTDDCKFKFKCASKYKRCILKVHSLLVDNILVVLTMATDGIINFWDFSCLLPNVDKNRKDLTPTVFKEIYAHQSGINSFDLKKINSNEYLIVTGGDDNLLSLILLKVTTPKSNSRFNRLAGIHRFPFDVFVTILSMCRSSDCHYTQITGVKFFDKDKLCSVGTDQNVIVHRYFFDKLEISIKKEKEITTCVSDVQGITLCESNEDGNTVICTYGKGFQFITKTQ